MIFIRAIRENRFKYIRPSLDVNVGLFEYKKALPK